MVLSRSDQRTLDDAHARGRGLLGSEQLLHLEQVAFNPMARGGLREQLAQVFGSEVGTPRASAGMASA